MSTKIPFYKICICGDFSVGKTTLLHQYLERRFTPNIGSTIGSNFFAKYLKIPNIKDIFTLQIWDLAGQERYKWVRHEFYKGAKGIVYVFDLTRRETFESIIKWKDEIKKVLGNFSSVLVGNKVDLLNPRKRVIEKQEAESLKKNIAACAYIEASAKTGTGVKEFFLKLVSHLYKRS
ncbi:MAG: Rab family GTPase [Promethearchaeota archaeon]